MSRYRKMPVVIEATQWFDVGDHPNVATPPPHCTARSDMRCEKCGNASGMHGWIKTLEGGSDGAQLVCPGDWIITGIKSENYPCKPDIFEKTYIPVDAKNDTLPPMPSTGSDAPHSGREFVLPEISRVTLTSVVFSPRYDAVHKQLAKALLDALPTTSESDAPHSETVKTAPKDRIEQLESIVRELASYDLSEYDRQATPWIADLIRRSRELIGHQ